MRKRIGSLLCVFCLILGLTACTAPEAPATTQEPSAETETIPQSSQPIKEDGVIELTMAFVDPDTSPYVEGGRRIAELVSAATDGRIQIRVESSNALGERKLVELAMDGEFDIATCANSVMTNYIPQMNILDQAYLWKNEQEAHVAVDGTLGELIRDRAATLGLHIIGFEDSGFRNTFSVKPIRSMADFDGVTIRTMENKYHQAAFEAFGATPVALSYSEVMPALEAGRVDACENATANCLNSGYYQMTHYVTNTQHAFVYILLCMSDAAWQRIPEGDRQPFLDAVQEGVEWERNRLREANAEATEQLKALGVEFHDIDMTELQAAYRSKVAEKGFTFDAQWQAAVEEAIQLASEDQAQEEPALQTGAR